MWGCDLKLQFNETEWNTAVHCSAMHSSMQCNVQWVCCTVIQIWIEYCSAELQYTVQNTSASSIAVVRSCSLMWGSSDLQTARRQWPTAAIIIHSRQSRTLKIISQDILRRQLIWLNLLVKYIFVSKACYSLVSWGEIFSNYYILGPAPFRYISCNILQIYKIQD